jgi:hypothetical protein
VGHLDMRQRNNLLTGNELAAELPASAAGRRAFVAVVAYRDTGMPGEAAVSKFLDADTSDVRFSLSKYEVERALMDAGGWLSEDDVHGLVFTTGIASLEALEAELAAYLDDFSRLSTACDNPL